MGKFNKGFFLGSVVGAGLIWLSTTKKGRETKARAIVHGEKLFEIAKEKALATESWGLLSKTKFAGIVSAAAAEYSQKNGLADNIRKITERLATAKWGELKKEKPNKK
ncbi:MAG: hypothetical protein AAB390_02350 [Patescibacteria group bacterium]